MKDWAANDKDLLTWRAETGNTAFEKTEATAKISEQEFFDNGLLMVAFVRAGVELAFAFKARWSREFGKEIAVTLVAN